MPYPPPEPDANEQIKALEYERSRHADVIRSHAAQVEYESKRAEAAERTAAQWQARAERLQAALVTSAIPLEGLNAAARWELAPDVKVAIWDAVQEIRAVLFAPPPATPGLRDEKSEERNRIREIVIAEYKYWRNAEELIGVEAIGALANVLVKIDGVPTTGKPPHADTVTGPGSPLFDALMAEHRAAIKIDLTPVYALCLADATTLPKLVERANATAQRVSDWEDSCIAVEAALNQAGRGKGETK